MSYRQSRIDFDSKFNQPAIIADSNFLNSLQFTKPKTIKLGDDDDRLSPQASLSSGRRAQLRKSSTDHIEIERAGRLAFRTIFSEPVFVDPPHAKILETSTSDQIRLTPDYATWVGGGQIVGPMTVLSTLADRLLDVRTSEPVVIAGRRGADAPRSGATKPSLWIAACEKTVIQPPNPGRQKSVELVPHALYFSPDGHSSDYCVEFFDGVEIPPSEDVDEVQLGVESTPAVTINSIKAVHAFSNQKVGAVTIESPQIVPDVQTVETDHAVEISSIPISPKSMVKFSVELSPPPSAKLEVASAKHAILIDVMPDYMALLGGIVSDPNCPVSIFQLVESSTSLPSDLKSFIHARRSEIEAYLPALDETDEALVLTPSEEAEPVGIEQTLIQDNVLVGENNENEFTLTTPDHLQTEEIPYFTIDPPVNAEEEQMPEYPEPDELDNATVESPSPLSLEEILPIPLKTERKTAPVESPSKTPDIDHLTATAQGITAFSTFSAILALVRMQRKIRRRYRNQREELINGLGL